jgi:DNA polymerase-3 subunit alpha
MNFTKLFNNIEIKNLNLVRLPSIHFTNEEKGLFAEKSNTNEEFLQQLINDGWKKIRDRIPENKKKIYFDRIKEEFEIVKDLGFIDYFLLVWRVINKAKKLGAFIDWGRGSAAGSLIFYLIGVTGVDPIDKNLFFTRFISKARAKKEIINGVTYIQGDLAPDVDINLGGVRDEIIEWLKKCYPNKVCKISSVSTFSGKILVKDVFKIINEASEEQAVSIADAIGKHFGVVEDLEESYKNSEKFKAWADEYPETYNIALKLRGLIRGKSTHASGYFLSYYPLDKFVPIEKNKEGELSVSYEMNTAAKFGIKLDLLGLISNEIIKNIFELIPEKLESINLDDNELVYTTLQSEDLLPYGLYQISADCAYRVCKNIKPANIHELSDVNAIARPGALAYEKNYVNFTGEAPHEKLQSVFASTRNLPLYQEQLIQALVTVGFTADESEYIRRIIGKKKKEEMPQWKNKVFEVCEKNGFGENVAESIWKVMIDSADYSFNKSHSVCVSYLGALTVYLKYKYPLEFFTACLNASQKLPNPMDEIRLIQQELSHFNIKLLPPHLLKSQINFTIEGNNIRYGLSAIKGISDAAMEKMVNFRGDYDNKIDCFITAKQVGLNIGILSSLIQAGALEDLKTKRTRLVLEAQTFNILTEKEKRLVKKIHDETEEKDVLNIIKTLADKNHIKPARFESIKNKYYPYKEIYLMNSRNENLANYFYEKNCLGFSFSENITSLFKKKNPNFCSIEDVIKNKDINDEVLIVGEILDTRVSKSRNNNKFYRANVADDTSNITVLLFDGRFNQLDEFKKINNGTYPDKNDIVIIKGKKKNDAIFAENIVKQNCKIYKNMRELKATTDSQV